MITFEDFKKLDIRIGKVLSVEKIEGADKLLKLEVDFGDPSSFRSSGQVPSIDSTSSLQTDSGLGKRQIVSGIAEFYAPEDLIGKEFPFVMNLEPRVLRGVESNGMIMAVSVDGRAVLLQPIEEVPPGSVVK